MFQQFTFLLRFHLVSFSLAALCFNTGGKHSTSCNANKIQRERTASKINLPCNAKVNAERKPVCHVYKQHIVMEALSGKSCKCFPITLSMLIQYIKESAIAVLIIIRRFKTVFLEMSTNIFYDRS